MTDRAGSSSQFPPAPSASPLRPTPAKIAIATAICAIIAYPAMRPSGWVTGTGLALLLLVLRSTYRAWRRTPYAKAAETWASAEKRRHSQVLEQRATAMSALSPRQFEGAIANMFRALGYRVTQTAYVADGGWDLELFRGDTRILVECKQWAAKQMVGRPVLQKLHSATVTERATGGMVVTTAGFSAPARAFAQEQGMFPVDGTRLNEMLVDAFPGADDAGLLYGLCSTCARLAAFPALASPLVTGCSTPLSLCPNGHVVRHPSIISIHPSVSDRAKASFLSGQPTVPADLARQARIRELTLLRAPDAELASGLIGKEYQDRAEAERVATLVNDAHRRVVSYDVELAELRQQLTRGAARRDSAVAG